MTDKRTSELTAMTAATTDDLFLVLDNPGGTPALKTITGTNLMALFPGATVKLGVEIFPATITVTTGDGKVYTPPIPLSMNGMNLVTVVLTVFAKSTSGVPTVQIARGRQANSTSAHTFADMLSTRVTIDANEYCSTNATTAYVINTSNDDIATGDIFRFDVDVAGTGTTGLWVTMEFRLP
jgi:hypothetical protein